MRCIVFDLDSTLCAIGKEILPEDVALLKELEDKGNRICICSGKPTYYLVGMFRQVGLKAPVFVGENGGVIQFGVHLPPVEYHLTTKKLGVVRKLKSLRADMEDKFGANIWFQPNEIELTAFPNNENLFDEIEEFINQHHIDGITVYRQVDCFDIVPTDVSKRGGLEYLANLLGLESKDFVAVGDGINDYPMFDYAGLSVGVKVKDKTKVTVNFDSVNQALQYLLTL